MVEKIDLRPKVLELIKEKGPLIPRELSKEIGQDTFIVGAVLAQLRDSGEILASNTKVGGSPAYYVEGQEANLQNLERFLDPKSKEAYQLLKNSKVLRDYSQNVQVRFSLRQLKDFAQDLTVDVHGADEIFWKWYLTPIDEAEPLILDMIKLPEVEKKIEKPKQDEQVIIENKKEEVANKTELSAQKIIDETNVDETNLHKESKTEEYQGIQEIILEEVEDEEKLDTQKTNVSKEKEEVEILKKESETKRIKKPKKESNSSGKKASKHKAKKEKPVQKKEEKKGFLTNVKKFFKF